VALLEHIFRWRLGYI